MGYHAVHSEIGIRVQCEEGHVPLQLIEMALKIMENPV